MGLTVKGLQALKPGKWMTESAKGDGQLRAKGSAKGARFYFRYRRADGTTDDLPLGRFDPRGRDGLTLEEAKERAGDWRKRYMRGERDLRAALEADQRETEQKRRAMEVAAAAAKEAETSRRERTLGALLQAYASQLDRDGKPSARKVRRALELHVRDKWPKCWGTPVDDVTTDDLLAIVAVPANAGNLRQAEKIRAYLRAAFSAGIKARHNASALPALRALRITSNPAASLTTIEGANKARNRALSLAELRAYWQRIQTPDHAALRFHLLTGCQRIQQLARATQSDFDVDVQCLRLLDKKGRRKQARNHHVPLLPGAIDAMKAMHGGEAGPYVFTFTAGQSGADQAGIFRRVRKVADAMVANDELPGGMFTPGDLRRTVETRLADAGVSREVRGRLQSHGLGGVQDRHYDRHDYLKETRAALETLHRLMTETSSEVVAIRRERA